MKLLCKLFGHRPAFGYGGIEGNGYFNVKLGPIDGINRQHASLFCKCERCNEEYQVGKIHVPERTNYYTPNGFIVKPVKPVYIPIR